jgi:hypothetical protein
MTKGALIMMVVVQVTVTVITLYFFLRVLLAPKREKNGRDT